MLCFVRHNFLVLGGKKSLNQKKVASENLLPASLREYATAGDSSHCWTVLVWSGYLEETETNVLKSTYVRLLEKAVSSPEARIVHYRVVIVLSQQDWVLVYKKTQDTTLATNNLKVYTYFFIYVCKDVCIYRCKNYMHCKVYC